MSNRHHQIENLEGTKQPPFPMEKIRGGKRGRGHNPSHGEGGRAGEGEGARLLSTRTGAFNAMARSRGRRGGGGGGVGARGGKGEEGGEAPRGIELDEGLFVWFCGVGFEVKLKPSRGFRSAAAHLLLRRVGALQYLPLPVGRAGLLKKK